MPGRPDKTHRIRVRTLDGKPREWKHIHGLLGGQSYVRVYPQAGDVEFVLKVDSVKQRDDLRVKFATAGLEEITGGDTAIPARAPATQPANRQRGQQQRSGHQQQNRGGPQGRHQSRTPETDKADLRKKPYGFVPLSKDLTTAAPIWHDGTSSAGRHSGEIRFELETLTPLLVGWERGQVGDKESDWPVPATLDGVGQLANNKSVLSPMRAPWGQRPVIIPGDSLKGLLRHELGALLGAPMERVAERSYSYRPNAMFAQGAQLIPRIARVPNDGVEMKDLDDKTQIRVPTKLELLTTNLQYDKKKQVNGRWEWTRTSNYYRFDDGNGAMYRGGQGAGEKLNSERNLHKKLAVNPSQPTETVTLSQAVQVGYLATVRHLVDLDHGHFSERHPDAKEHGANARTRILKAAKDEVFQPGDLVWVEWDTEKKCVVSLGWHYYYRWAYTDSVRKIGGKLERHGLFPLDKEREKNGDAPKELSAVRRLLGYIGDNEGSAGIGEVDYSQLMGRVFVNAGFEVVGEGDTDEQRFLPPTFLKELGRPRPSAVEYYLQQPHHPRPRPSDNATLVTYGDAIGYDTPGDLAGRKFYLDRRDAYGPDGQGLVPGPAAEATAANKLNDRSTLAIEASKPRRKFRFTVRFRDVDASELSAILLALSPDQFKHVLGGTHKEGYCSKLGCARPLGWGSVRIEAKALLLLNEAGDAPTLKPEADVAGWVTNIHKKTATQDEWLAIHRRNHPNADDYPRPSQADRNGERNIYTFHTTLRAEHSRNRRYRK
jgi:CRISPR-associated protein (TIGR03986 family)